MSEYCYIKSIPPKHVLPQIRGLGGHTTFLIYIVMISSNLRALGQIMLYVDGMQVLVNAVM